MDKKKCLCQHQSGNKKLNCNKKAQWPWCFQIFTWLQVQELFVRAYTYLSIRVGIQVSETGWRNATFHKVLFSDRRCLIVRSDLNTFLTFWSTLKLFKLMFLGCEVVRVITECKWNEWFTSNRIPMLCAKDSGIARGQTDCKSVERNVWRKVVSSSKAGNLDKE